MLLGHKKVRGEEKNWCVVLNAVQTEIDKKKFAQKISGLFSLSPEESSDLVVSTPIILLDNLTHGIASKLKDYLAGEGIQIILTNDIFLKRKCYRTVWPEPPSLNFLHEWSPSSKPESVPASAAAEEGAREISPQPAEPLKTEEKREPSVHEKLMQEAERWKNECGLLKQETYRLRTEVDRLQREKISVIQFARQNPETAGSAQETDKSVKELRAVLSNLEEKYEVLKEEYREARSFFEEKMAANLQENDQLRKKHTELGEELLKLRAETESRERDGREMSEHYLKLKQEYESLKKTFEERVQTAQTAVTRASELKELDQEVAALKEKNSGLERELNLVLRAQHSEKMQRINLEANLREAQEKQSALAADLEKRSEEVNRLETALKQTGESLNQLRHSHERRDQLLQETLRKLEARERDLKGAHAQVMELTEKLHHKESELHLAQILSHLESKEKHLHWLVTEQERIEAHIREREEAMKKILAEQEAVEKELIDHKQKQRLLQEQNQKEVSQAPKKIPLKSSLND